MKKLLLTVALVAAVTAAYAQGNVSINNAGSANFISIKPLAAALDTMPGSTAGGPYTFAVLYAPSTVTGFVPFTGTSPAAWNATEASLAGYNVAGYIANGATAIGRVGTTVMNIPTTQPGDSVNLVMVGFKGTGTWADLVAATPAPAWAGTSKLVTVTLGGGAISTPSFFGVGANQSQGFVINEVLVPEPTSFALLGLGAAGLLIFRRR